MPRLASTLILAGLLLIATQTTAALAAEPRHCIPVHGLVAYVEYEGLDAHAATWTKTAAHDLLYKTPTGVMLVGLFKQLADRPIRDEIGVLDASSVLETADLLIRQGFAVALYCDADWDFGLVLVVKGFGRTPIARKFPLSAFGDKPRRILGRDVYPFLESDDDESGPNPLHVDEPPGSRPEPLESVTRSVWMEGDDLILVFGVYNGETGRRQTRKRQVGFPDSETIVLDTIEGKEPNITTHEGFRSAVAEGGRT